MALQKKCKISSISCIFDTLRDPFVCPPIHLVTGLISRAVCRVGEMFQHVRFCVFLQSSSQCDKKNKIK